MVPAGASVVEDWIEILDFLTDSGLPFSHRMNRSAKGRRRLTLVVPCG